MKKYHFTADPFGRAFTENKHLSLNERIALGMLEAAKYTPIEFPECCMLPTVLCYSESMASMYVFGSGIYVNHHTYNKMEEQFPEHESDIEELHKYMTESSTGTYINNCLTESDIRLTKAMACWGGTWGGHCNISFGKLPQIGTNAIRTEISEKQKLHPDKSSFYNACSIAMDSLDVYGDRIRDMAKQNSEACTDPALCEEWRRIAKTFEQVPRLPARDFYEAVMVYWMLFTLDGIDSPGRFDQEMIDLYRKTPEAEAKSILRRFLEGIHYVRGWNLCISGSDEKGNDETNELSYAILELVTEMRYQTPNLTMRVHPQTPEKLWEMAVKCLATGTGLPAIYNDEVVCPALEKLGIPPHDSHDYCMNGCNQIDIMGKSHMGLEDGEVNFAKALELTLHNGYDTVNVSDTPLSVQSGNPALCNTFDDFLNCYYTQLRSIIDAATRMSNSCQEVYARYAPNPMRSCFVEGCLDKGLDYKNGGPLYGHGQILAQGIADTADSLYAIKKLIFDDKKYTMSELIDALSADFSGYGQLYKDFSTCAKFGNDIPEVDAVAKEITDHFFAYLKTIKTFRGGIFTGGCSPFSRVSVNAVAVGALPNGKHKKENILADSIAATPGRDKNGPTASINSMLCYEQTEACSGFISQMKFSKSLFETEKGQSAFVTLAKTYFQNGGQQLSVNVLDRKALLEAREHPELYSNLIVRVGGYSDYFCNLSPELQQNVIDRSEFAV